MLEITDNEIKYCDFLTSKICYRLGVKLTEDHIQEGRLGMCIAAEKYDPGRGIKFMSYASYWINGLIMRKELNMHWDRGRPLKPCVYATKSQKNVDNQLDRHDALYKGDKTPEDDCIERDLVMKVLEDLPRSAQIGIIEKVFSGTPMMETAVKNGWHRQTPGNQLSRWRNGRGKMFLEGE